MNADADEFRSLATSELIARFSDDARRMSNVHRQFEAGDFKTGSSEFKFLFVDLKAVSRELRARNAAVEIRQMFESEDDAVRHFATTHFWTLDRELAQAASSGARFGEPTREALRLMRLARDTPKDVPILTELTVDDLIASFVDASIRLYGARFLDCAGVRADREIRTRIARHVRGIARELKSRGAVGRLVPLMDHANERVRLDAAIASLDLEPQKAAAILEGVVKRGREEFDVTDAKRSLRLRPGGKSVDGDVR